MDIRSSQLYTSLMSQMLVNSMPLECPTLESWVVREVELQLGTLPSQITQSIDKTQAIAYVLKFVSPMGKKSETEWQWPSEQTGRILQELIADAATLSLIRLMSTHRVSN
ncbi:hypothetical protein VB834_27730 [Limnoraphis robusta Tam1]|jgi:hypothetical protein|uniref:hypothetical protein n=2 Tax=Limnoraphis robusta TaxID=1118279 RepID=UPI002B200B3B|nr:hypothetical protein [Limnoraphis robusta]MEA5542825.1 hypothetical protein [Limnoraphis robusta Tam1]